ncbi:hypothetical protein MesoLj131a_19220 [Mesorhizobium sp. 131-2-1]|nr:hypothetical protein MesoLj131a_19220 [Mesorhizobium sp. 131-2-1]
MLEKIMLQQQDSEAKIRPGAAKPMVWPPWTNRCSMRLRIRGGGMQRLGQVVRRLAAGIEAQEQFHADEA